MSKFNIGDEVFLSPDSKWADMSGCNPLNVIGVVDELETLELSRGELGIGVLWSNGIHNSYRDCDLIPAEQPTQECPYALIEELRANIESLEELVSEQAERIRELEAHYIQEQAACYRRLNDLLTSHRSFQESNECRSNELADTIKLLQLCYDSRYGF